MLYRYLILLLPEADEGIKDKAFFSEHEDGLTISGLQIRVFSSATQEAGRLYGAQRLSTFAGPHQ